MGVRRRRRARKPPYLYFPYAFYCPLTLKQRAEGGFFYAVAVHETAN